MTKRSGSALSKRDAGVIGNAGACVAPARIPEQAGESVDAAARYRALASRDRRFDGKFFVGVRTRKIYCRPICPAPTAHARNVEFYACAAAAAKAGYRPCLRCRPESAPGSAAWLGTSSTVLRAFRLIQAGALDEAAPDRALTTMDRTAIDGPHLMQ